MLFHAIFALPQLHIPFAGKNQPDMDMPLRIGFIGAGNMAYGIAKGILSGKLKWVGRRKPNTCMYLHVHTSYTSCMYNFSTVLYALLLHVEAEG